MSGDVRPLVALTCYAEPASWGAWHDVPASLVPQGYVDALRAAGARVVLVPPEQELPPGEAADLLSRCDALVVAGGVDIEPWRYGQVPHDSVQSARADRDDSELALVRAAVDVDLPLLGVCRGMQVMAVAAGGVLDQHLPDRTGTDAHSPAPGAYGWNHVRTEPGTLLARVLGTDLDVPCHHHQGVALHPGYRVGAVADDGVVEAMEDPSARFRVGVQWHPETDTDLRIFQALVAAAGARPAVA